MAGGWPLIERDGYSRRSLLVGRGKCQCYISRPDMRGFLFFFSRFSSPPSGPRISGKLGTRCRDKRTIIFPPRPRERFALDTQIDFQKQPSFRRKTCVSCVCTYSTRRILLFYNNYHAAQLYCVHSPTQYALIVKRVSWPIRNFRCFDAAFVNSPHFGYCEDNENG